MCHCGFPNNLNGGVSERDEIIGLDLPKGRFQVHAADQTGRAVLRKKLGRGQVFEYGEGGLRQSALLDARDQSFGSRSQADPSGQQYALRR